MIPVDFVVHIEQVVDDLQRVVGKIGIEFVTGRPTFRPAIRIDRFRALFDRSLDIRGG